METLIDMYELPGESEYALWAYQGSGVEHFWDNPGQFIEQFDKVHRMLKQKVPVHKEYDIEERFNLVIQERLNNKNIKEYKEIIIKLVANYWQKYKSMCYVSQEVVDTLGFLAEKNQMAIISNFIVKDGVEELLKINGLEKFFDIVVTSANEGWRKPHPYLYSKALSEAGATAAETIYIGDDYVNDYITPSRLGFKAFLYDRKNNYIHVKNRFTSMSSLKKIIPTISSIIF